MTPILIRSDASLAMGSGHVMRCRTLARALRHLGAAVTFLCRRQPGDLIGLLEEEFPVVVLPEQPRAHAEGLQGRALYEALLGCGQEKDATDCLAALREVNISTTPWLVVDHYGLDAAWETQMLDGLSSTSTPKLLVIDDLADRPHRSDLLLDQNFFGENSKSRYQELLPDHCRTLLGPSYALLGPEYANKHSMAVPREELQRLLVFFGGADQNNLTGQVLSTLMAPELEHLAVDVVVGRQSTNHHLMLAELAGQRPFTTLHGPLPSLIDLIAQADLFIGAGGATTWERACLGLPGFVISIAENQVAVALAMQQHQYSWYLGEASQDWRSRLHQKLTDKSLLRSLPSFSRRCLTLTAGEGAKIIARFLLDHNNTA